MKKTALSASILIGSLLAAEPKQLSIDEVCALTACRESYSIKLYLDKENIYKEKLDRSPYIFNDLAYICPGESFYIDVELSSGKITKLSYSKEKKADTKQIHLSFSQENQGEETPMMMLKVSNPFDQALSYEAGMLLHDRDGVFGTSIIPVMPNLVSFETWPYPIVQLIIANFQLIEEGGEAIDVPPSK